MSRRLSRPSYILVCLLGLLLLGGWFRVWQIDSLPPGLFGDEATDGLDALDVLAGRGAVFFPANFGREGLHVWIVAGTFRLWSAIADGTGINPMAIRLPSVLAGILTVLATYWLGLELAAAGNRGELSRYVAAHSHTSQTQHRNWSQCWAFVPLLAALYLSTSYFHVHFSRFGIRGVFTPLCTSLAFAAFWRGVNLSAHTHPLRTEDMQRQAALSSPMLWFGVAGFFLGLGLHFYTASRFLPLFLAGFLVLQAVAARLAGRGEDALLPRLWRPVLFMYAVALAVFAPLGVYFLQHPGSFSQRASAVSAFGDANPWQRMAQAAAANVLQFFLPGRGDLAQFYNLPGRAVFDELTALLAVCGLVALLLWWRRPAALFLLTWWPALLLPSFLATDRFPTLPRVLGTVPGIYFFPAAGAAAIAVFGARCLRRVAAAGPWRRLVPILSGAFLVVAVALHGGLTYRDYFLSWAPSAATFDAFEGDMVAAWRWLARSDPGAHVYLSSDIYRHPTFMLLHEHATVTTYFQHRNDDLSWFDGRAALPLPPPGRPALYLVSASSAPTGRAAQFLATHGHTVEQIPAPDGSSALTVVALPAEASWRPGTAQSGASDVAVALSMTAQLSLIGAELNPDSEGVTELWLQWQTRSPIPGHWQGYRLQLNGKDGNGAEWQTEEPFDAFRPTEWVPGGSFITQHELPAGAAVGDLRLRLLEPAGNAAGEDGWQNIASILN